MKNTKKIPRIPLSLKKRKYLEKMRNKKKLTDTAKQLTKQRTLKAINK